jgi:hypothetical protein
MATIGLVTFIPLYNILREPLHAAGVLEIMRRERRDGAMLDL